MSFETIIDFAKKIPSLLNLTASIVLTQLRWKTVFIGLVNEI